MSQRQLFHFTCHHGLTGISKTGVLLVQVHPFMQQLGPLLWLTDLPTPSADSVGLTSSMLTCDRLAYRYLVHTRAAKPWSELRSRVPLWLLEDLESYSDPAHWWVVRRSLLASEFALDATYQAVMEAAS